MKKIKITEPGFTNLTGDFGGIQFEEGVSVVALGEYEMNRLGSAIRLEVIDGGAATFADQFTQSGDTRADVVVASERGTEPEPESEVAESDSEEGTDDEEKGNDYTEEELAAIADAKGIAGLRAIAAELDVRGNSISGLIKSILFAQGG